MLPISENLLTTRVEHRLGARESTVQTWPCSLLFYSPIVGLSLLRVSFVPLVIVSLVLWDIIFLLWFLSIFPFFKLPSPALPFLFFILLFQILVCAFHYLPIMFFFIPFCLVVLWVSSIVVIWFFFPLCPHVTLLSWFLHLSCVLSTWALQKAVFREACVLLLKHEHVSWKEGLCFVLS